MRAKYHENFYEENICVVLKCFYTHTQNNYYYSMKKSDHFSQVNKIKLPVRVRWTSYAFRCDNLRRIHHIKDISTETINRI